MTIPPRRNMGSVLAAALGLIASLHAYWALGGTWGLSQALGGPDKPIPPAWLIWLVTALLVTAAAVVLGRVGIWSHRLPRWLFALGCWGLTGVILLVSLLNFAGDTNWERFVFGPVALILALAAGVVASAPAARAA